MRAVMLVLLCAAATARGDEIDLSIRRLFAAEPPSRQLLSRERRIRWERVLGDGRLKFDDMLASVAVSGDAKRVAAGSYSGEVAVWDRVQGGLVARLRLATGPRTVSAVAMNRDGSLLAATDYTQLAVWDVRSRKERLRLDLPRVESLLFSPDADLLAAAAPDGVRILTADGGRAVGVLPHERARRLQSLEGDLLVSVSQEALLLWDWRTREPRGTVRPGADMVVLGLARGGAVAYGYRGPDRRACAWNTSDWTAAGIEGLPSAHVVTLSGMAMSPRGRVALWDESARRVWFPHREDRVPPPSDPKRFLGAWIAYAPDGSFVACAAMDGTLTLWDPETGNSSLPSEGHRSSIVGLALLDEGRVLLSAGRDGTLQHWNSVTGERQRVIRAHDLEMDGFDAKGELLATVSGFKIRLWRFPEGSPLREIPLKEAAAPGGGIAVSPDGERIFYAAVAGVIAYWPPSASGRFWIRDTYALAAVSSDGRLVVTDSMSQEDRSSGLVALFEPDGRGKRRVIGPAGQATSLAFHPAGRLLAVGCRDGTIRILDVRSGEEASTLRGHVGDVLAFAWSEDGTRLWSTGADLTLRCWDVGGRVETDSIDLGARSNAIAVLRDRIWVGSGDSAIRVYRESR